MPTARDRLVNLLDAYRASTVSAALDDYETEALAEAHARVAALPTANDGQLICATREQILDAIIPAGGAR